MVKWSLIWMFSLTWAYKSYIKFIRDHSFNTTAPFMYTLQYSNFLYNMLFLVVPNSLSRWRLMFLLTIPFQLLICIWMKSLVVYGILHYFMYLFFTSFFCVGVLYGKSRLKSYCTYNLITSKENAKLVQENVISLWWILVLWLNW